MGDRFENLLLAAQKTGSAVLWRDALANIADTALICRAWLKESEPNYKTADLLLMVRMVVDVERDAANRARLGDL